MFHIPKTTFLRLKSLPPKPGIEQELPLQCGRTWCLLRTVPCYSTAGVAWRPPHPLQAGSACPGTPLFPPQRQLGRSDPKPGSRPGISSLSPQVTDPPAVQVRGQCCQSQACEIFPKSRSHHAAPIPSFPKAGRAWEGCFLCTSSLPREKLPDPKKETKEGLTLCPSPMTR